MLHARIKLLCFFCQSSLYVKQGHRRRRERRHVVSFDCPIWMLREEAFARFSAGLHTFALDTDVLWSAFWSAKTGVADYDGCHVSSVNLQNRV
jgi:hypothetical protein